MTGPQVGSAIRFGDQVFQWDEAAAARTGRPVLVTQVGRSFQQQHPDVPVLLDHGRHLVVALPDLELPHVQLTDLEQGTAEAEAVPVHPDWRVDPMPEGGTVVVHRPEAAARAIDPVTAELLDALSRESFEGTLGFLAGLPTRHSLSAGFREAADHMAALLTDRGYAVSRPAITVGSGSSSNVIGDLAGSGEGPRGVVLITAHLDSINLPGGPSAPAPGADDNGSGSAGVPEMARVLSGRPWRHDLRVILFGGEEEGLHGSRQYVRGLPGAERARIRAVLNLDMVGSLNTAAPTVLLEGAPRSAALINDLATAAATATGLTVETSLNPFASDHVPFLDAGIPAVLTIEGADSANGNIHSANDTLDTVDPALAMEILRMDVAALVGWLEPVDAAPRPAGSVVSWGPGRLDVFGIGAGSG
ncbi:Zn-dependent exopeptidase M28 [Blastococcus sp. CT_GayMR20]|uniref:M28 family metallopeptidase n=1 Tax=Blastococcus sp. CT_GayMR20 TaxID=2559609 RepID=UPI001073A1C2|nr:M20/M25/M40 family metallo-hydrolase [Blastococcus sp. CT_GayMR20]TFV66466.1 Zn-dependent exopeptidase M28 [Blastococcus sp. CT_GayMR20]